MVTDWNGHLTQLAMCKGRDYLDNLIGCLLEHGHCFAVETIGPEEYSVWTTDAGAQRLLESAI